jgi:hypothetical protein
LSFRWRLSLLRPRPVNFSSNRSFTGDAVFTLGRVDGIFDRSREVQLQAEQQHHISPYFIHPYDCTTKIFKERVML